MSVTFTYCARDGEVVMHGIPCQCREIAFPGYTWWEADPWSETYQAFHSFRCEHKILEVNLSNHNAFGVLEAIGLRPEPSCIVGDCSAHFFLQQLRLRGLVHRREELMALCEDAIGRNVNIGWS